MRSNILIIILSMALVTYLTRIGSLALFRFTGVPVWLQGWLKHFLARAGRSMVTNDPLRHIVVDFLTSDFSLFDKLVKYGKQKGWLEPVPIYNSK